MVEGHKDTLVNFPKINTLTFCTELKVVVVVVVVSESGENVFKCLNIKINVIL